MGDDRRSCSTHSQIKHRSKSMSTSIKSYVVSTSHGDIAVDEAGEGSTALLFIHGNSSCRKIFRHQMTGPLSGTCRLIAFDLPGHGESADAIDPHRTYTRPGFADSAIELLQTMGIRDVIVLGWSLGGHIAIEMSARFEGIRGLAITGTPAIGHGEAALGFRRSGAVALGRKTHLSESEVMDFARGMTGEPVEPFLVEAIARADGNARDILFKARDVGAGIDQRRTVESRPIPIAVINGADDAFINLDFVDQIAYANLWSGRCHRIPGHGHAAFWSGAHLFNPLLERFVQDVVKA